VDDHHKTRRRERIFKYGVIGFFSAPTVLWVALLDVCRRGGWRSSLLVISLALNLFCGFVFVLAFLIAGEEPEVKESPPGTGGAIPPGFEWAQQGPLYFARVRTDSSAGAILGESVFITQDGCLVAGFDFTDGTPRIERAVLYDSKCLSKIEFDVLSGATSIMSYTQDGIPGSSLTDEDGDGVPDVKIEWDGPKSFRRSGHVTWVPTSDANAPDQVSNENATRLP
jgi:hypothetical protein